MSKIRPQSKSALRVSDGHMRFQRAIMFCAIRAVRTLKMWLLATFIVLVSDQSFAIFVRFVAHVTSKEGILCPPEREITVRTESVGEVWK